MVRLSSLGTCSSRAAHIAAHCPPLGGFWHLHFNKSLFLKKLLVYGFWHVTLTVMYGINNAPGLEGL